MCPDNTQKKNKNKNCALELTLSVYLNNGQTQLSLKVSQSSLCSVLLIPKASPLIPHV